jgi:hypothetical protein
MSSRLFPWSILGLIAFVLLAVPRAGAEPIPWSYQGQVVTTGPSTGYNWKPLGPHVLVSTDFPDGSGINPSSRTEFADVTGTGSASTSVTAFQMRANTYFDGGSFFKNVHTFNLGFAIRDTASDATGSISFQGTVDGFMRAYPKSGLDAVDLQVGFTGATQKSLVLGDHLYKVSIDPYHFQFFQDLSGVKTLPIVTPYQDVPINVQVSDVPEPSALALASAGLAGLGLRAWRRRARRSPR